MGWHRFIATFAVALVLSIFGCGGSGDGDGVDAGGGADSGGGDRDAASPGEDAATSRDAALPHDAAVPVDAAVPEDSAAPTDATSTDAGTRADAAMPPTCSDDLGAPCETTDECASGLECQIGRCAPQDRDVCGGFAGWTCPRTAGSPYTECLYYDGADFGPCFTPAEAACLCARPDPGFACP